MALKQAEEHAHQQSYEPPAELFDLLRRTHHIEEAAFEVKRKLAENSLITAKDQVQLEELLPIIRYKASLLDEQDFQDAKRLLWCSAHCPHKLHRRCR